MTNNVIDLVLKRTLGLYIKWTLEPRSFCVPHGTSRIDGGLCSRYYPAPQKEVEFPDWPSRPQKQESQLRSTTEDSSELNFPIKRVEEVYFTLRDSSTLLDGAAPTFGCVPLRIILILSCPAKKRGRQLCIIRSLNALAVRHEPRTGFYGIKETPRHCFC